MLVPHRSALLPCLVLIAALAVGTRLWLANRSGHNQHPVNEAKNTLAENPQQRVQATETPRLAGNLQIATQTVEEALSKAKWASAATGHRASAADIFVTSVSALASGDIRTFALAMRKPAQSAFLEGRSIDDPYLQTLPQKMAKAGFQFPTVEAFKAQRTNGGCKLVATLSCVRGTQKICEEITMELYDSPSGWLIEKYESRTSKREAVTKKK